MQWSRIREMKISNAILLYIHQTGKNLKRAIPVASEGVGENVLSYTGIIKRSVFFEGNLATSIKIKNTYSPGPRNPTPRNLLHKNKSANL